MSIGYIKLSRALKDSQIWNEEPFSRGQAWVDLLMFTAFKDHSFRVRGNKVRVKRGQCGLSQLTMAQRWRWSRGKVRRFLKDLEEEEMIVQEAGHLTTLITICNFERFQGDGTADDTTDLPTDGTADGQQTDSRRYTKKKDKKEKKEKNIENPPAAKPKSILQAEKFEEAFAAMPKRHKSHNRRSAEKAWNARMKEGVDPDLIIAGVKRYEAHVSQGNSAGTEFVKEAATFFGPNHHFDDAYNASTAKVKDDMMRMMEEALK